MQLSERYVRDVKPKNVRQEISDASGAGLMLVVQMKRSDGNPSAKTFVWRGRVPDGSIKKVTIGRADVMKLTDARMKAMAFTKMVREGRDPRAETTKAKAVEAETAMTVSKAFEEYIKRDAEEKKLKTVGEKRRIFKKDVEPVLGSKAITAVSEDDLADLLCRITERASGAGNLAHALLSRFFGWCAEASRGRPVTKLRANPMQHVGKPADKPKPRDRWLRENEIKWLLLACKALREEPMKKAGARENVAVRKWAIGVEVLLRTAQRKEDIMGLVDDEIDAEGVMSLSAERFKGGREHMLPLPAQVLRLLTALDRPNKSSTALFQRLGPHERNLAIIRAKMVEIAGKPVAHWSLHDLRRTFDTTLGDMWDERADRRVADRDVIEAVLGHSLKGVSRHYNHSQMLREKKRVLTYWNDWLDSLISAGAQPREAEPATEEGLDFPSA